MSNDLSMLWTLEDNYEAARRRWMLVAGNDPPFPSGFEIVTLDHRISVEQHLENIRNQAPTNPLAAKALAILTAQKFRGLDARANHDPQTS